MTVVLMHGFGAFMHLLAGVSVKPIVQTLRARGYEVHAPMVQPYSTVPERAATWMEHLPQIRSEADSDLHLVAFSSGGLDARYAIVHHGAHEFVASLTTISTPHRGSSLASYVLDSPSAIRAGVASLANWMGDRLQGLQSSDFERALREMTPEFLETDFNPATPDHPAVVYRSWAGRAGLGTDAPMLPVLRFPNRIVYDREGINDGIVSVESAKWTGFRGVIDADHARQIGVRPIEGAFDAADFIASLVRDLEAGYST